MTKIKSTKRTLVMSILSLVLCLSMFIGSTFAWFTDSVTSGNNKIIAGNLDVELEYANTPDGTYQSVEGVGDIFVTPQGATKGLWEPGHTEVAYLKVTNNGSLALKYNLSVSPFSEVVGKNAKGEDLVLSEILKFAATEPSETVPATYTRETASAAAKDSAVKLNEYAKNDVELLAGDSHYVALVVYMPEEIGNEANYRDVRPEIEFALTLFATQQTYENDSFNNQFDAAAPNYLPDGVSASDYGTNVAYANGTFYSTLNNALKAIHGNGAEENVLYIKPGADLGTINHAHVCSNLTVYGNGAYISAGERDFEIGFPQASGTSCEGIKDELTLNVYNLNGCAIWGSISASHQYNINVNLYNCEDVSKICLLKSGNTPSYALNVNIENCTFTGTDNYRDSAIYCQNLSTLTVSNTTFKDYAVGINQNNKDGVEIYTLTNCTFIDCSTASIVTTQTSYAAPIRAVASVAGTVTNLTINNCKFVYTGTEYAINGDILTFQDGNLGTVNVINK